MKFSKYFMLAGAAAMLAACSSEEPMPAPGTGSDIDLGEVDTYASFSIALPDDGTRAVTFEDGDASEYAVKNGKILIFGLPNGGDNSSAAGRGEAKFIAAAELEINNAEAGDAEISATHTSMKAAFQKGTFTASNYFEFYGVCILNYSENWLPSSGDSFKDWAENTTLNGDLVDSEGHFVMTNAAMYNSGNPYVLVKIDTSKIQDQAVDVKEDAASFYVQRVAAKMTLANAASTGTKTFAISGGDYDGSSATLTAWAMDLTRKTAYPVQNVWDNNVSKFFDKTSTSAKDWFHIGTLYPRCDWASSKFYTQEFTSASECLTNFNHISNASLTALSDKADYIRPNTVAYNRMSKGTTTRMMIKASFKLDGVAAGTTFYTIGTENKAYTAAQLKEKVADFCTETGMTDPVVTIKDTEAGYKTFADVIAVEDLKDEDKAALLEHLGIYNEAAAEIAVYLKGECYYPVYVRHFADEQEAAGVTVNTTANDKIVHFTDYTEAHTGRYGIQRNSWYEIKVNSISGPGLPTVPDPDPTIPVDRVDDDQRHMQVTTYIMKWSKRVQDTDL
jgi:hypothetical protein